MNIHEMIMHATDALKRVKKINSLNVRSIVDVEKDDNILLVCDTDDGIISSPNPWICFKVFVPRDALTVVDHPLDAKANIPQSAMQTLKIEMRIMFCIYNAYKEAKESISKK